MSRIRIPGLAAALLGALFALGAFSARADSVKLANGDTIHGEIIEWAVDYIVVDHPQLGRLRLSLDSLELDTGTPPSAGLAGTTFLRGWNRNINVGLNGKQGTTDSTNLTAGMNFNYRDDWKRWRVDGRYFFQDSDDGDNDNNGRADIRRDWLIPDSRWFAFATGRYQYDQFESWNQRLVGTIGPGFHLYETKKHKIDGLVGPTITHEFGDRDQTKWESAVGLDYAWQITEAHSFTLSNFMYFGHNQNAGENRNLTRSELRIRIAKHPALSLILGVDNEYENTITGDDERNTFKYYATLGMDF